MSRDSRCEKHQLVNKITNRGNSLKNNTRELSSSVLCGAGGKSKNLKVIDFVVMTAGFSEKDIQLLSTQ
ncbi:hypothetical protein, partial [Staphylococcus aureus]